MNNKYSELIMNLTDKELLKHLYYTQIILLIISFISGMIVFDDWPFLKHFDFKDTDIFYIGFSFGLLVVIIDYILMKVLPQSFYDDGGLNNRIFRNRTIGQIAFIAMVVSISEELLFRGVIQTKFGIVVASIIFAIIHYRYLFNLFLFLNIVLLSFLIGFIYEWTDNLAVTIVMHFTIDFLLGIIIMKKEKSKLVG